MRIVPTPGKIVEGTIEFKGKDLLGLTEAEMRQIRGKEIAYVPQDPTTTLDPVYRVGAQLSEVIMRHHDISRRDALGKSTDMLRNADMRYAEIRIDKHRHELRGGSR